MRDNATTNVASGAEERLLALRATLGESPLPNPTIGIRRLCSDIHSGVSKFRFVFKSV